MKSRLGKTKPPKPPQLAPSDRFHKPIPSKILQLGPADLVLSSNILSKAMVVGQDPKKLEFGWNPRGKIQQHSSRLDLKPPGRVVLSSTESDQDEEEPNEENHRDA